jgi:predicted nuclease of predicted toxin-antitoxin system
MQFLADENISNLVIQELVAAGHDVVSIRSAHRGLDDAGVLSLADGDRRILITEDRDFGELVVRQRYPVIGVLLLELDRLTNEGEATRVLAAVMQIAGRIAGHLVVVEPGRIRLRPIQWPVQRGLDLVARCRCCGRHTR